MDPRSQDETGGVHQDVALSSGETLGPVVASLGAAYLGSLNDLAVDHRSAGVPVAPFRLAHSLAKTVVGSVQPALYPPLAEVVVNGLPGRILPGQLSPRATAPQSR